MLQTITRHLRPFKRLFSDKKGLSNVIVIMLSLILIVVIVSNVVLWSYQMNQADWEKMQEKIEVVNVERIASSQWYTCTNEYGLNGGTRLTGTYADTWTANNISESFAEESGPISYNPTGYTLLGSTSYVSGSTSDLTTDDGGHINFKSFSSVFSPSPLYTHMENITIGGVSYYPLRGVGADTSGSLFSASASSTGRKLWAKFVYPLTAIAGVPASNWTVYYRAYKTGPTSVIHCDVDVLIRKADGTVRTVIGMDTATSSDLSDSWNTISGTLTWNDYTVEDETDLLEIDYYAHVVVSQSNRQADLMIDDSSLSAVLQSRIEGVMLPNQYTVAVELYGNSNIQEWQNLTWTIDSALTSGTVNVTMQLFDYDTTQYPSNGNGYLFYISSSTPNADETRNQTISVDPTHFRNSTGDWRIRIIGVKETSSQFDLGVDWVEFKTLSSTNSRLDANGEFGVDLSAYSPEYMDSIEIQVRYRAMDTLENWFLRAYNWTSGQYSDNGFNSSAGDLPSTDFKFYAVNLTTAWQSYLASNGTIRVEFCDAGPDFNQTAIDVDFVGVRALIDGARFSFRNNGASTCQIVSIWIINSTIHRRYDVNFFLDSGMQAEYLRVDISLPTDSFIVKTATARGNIAILREG